MTYVYGPINSRRLGVSLGVDTTPGRVCSFNCIYCEEACPTKNLTLERQEYAPTNKVIEEIIGEGEKYTNLDYITFSGSGEPTLHKDLGRIITEIKSLKVPVAVLTNSTLLHRSDVRSDLNSADLIVPSLDAIDEQTFKQINRPPGNLTAQDVTQGIKKLSQEFTGEIWLEILLVQGINDSNTEIRTMADFANQLNIDKIQLNTVSRGTTEQNVQGVSYEFLEQTAHFFDHPVEIYN